MRTELTDAKILSIPIPRTLETFVKERVASKGFHTVSEYVRALIRADQEQAARQRVEAKLLEAVERGDYRDVTREFWSGWRHLPRENRFHRANADARNRNTAHPDRAGSRSRHGRSRDLYPGRTACGSATVRREVRKAFQFLAEHPEAGRAYETAHPLLQHLRIWRVKGFEKTSILLSRGQASILIERVLYGGRDLEGVLAGEE